VIEMPRRSVTRFFIPMIDVLTLLFCIYLLLPMASETAQEPDSERAEREEKLRRLEAEVARRGEDIPAELREQIEKLRRDRVKSLQTRLAVRVLEIDPETGKLFYRNPDRVELRSEADAHELIRRDQEAQGVSKRELYYLILYPRDVRTSARPDQAQRRQYDRWFAGVAMGYDKPGLAPGRQP
jgi:hypothetical protein